MTEQGKSTEEEELNEMEAAEIKDAEFKIIVTTTRKKHRGRISYPNEKLKKSMH